MKCQGKDVNKIIFRKDMKWEQFYSMIWIQSQKYIWGNYINF